MAFRFAVATALAATVAEAAPCNNHGCGSASCREMNNSWCGLFNMCGRSGSCADDFAQYVAESDETQKFEKFQGGLVLTAAKDAVVADEEKKIEAQDAVEANFEVLTSQEQIDALPEELKMYFANGIPSGTAVLKLTAEVQLVEEAAPEEAAEGDAVEAQAAEGDNTEAEPAAEEDSEKAEEKKKVEVDQKATAAARSSFPADTLIFALNSANTDESWQFMPAKADFVKEAAEAKSFVAIVSPAVPDVKDAVQAQPDTPDTPPPTNEDKNTVKQEKSYLGWYLAGAGILLVVVAAFFYFQSGSDEDGEETEDETEEEV